MRVNLDPRLASVLSRAVTAALPPISLPVLAPHRATVRHFAPQSPPSVSKTNPPNLAKPLNPNQLHAARLLLAGHRVKDVAAALRVDPYTVSRWKSDPRFQRELTRQLDRAAPHGATPRHNSNAPAQNEPNANRGGNR